MDSTAPMDEWPQIGRTEVEPGSLDGPGMALTDLAAELGIHVDDRTRGDVPTGGWRVVRRHPTGPILFAAPATAERELWHVGSARSGDPATVHINPEAERLRASPAERRRGLVLRWAPHMFDTATPEDFIVDVVNDGETTWWPDGDTFRVVGVITEPGQSSYYAGWAGVHHAGGVPLRPGEYARVRVDVSNARWEDIEPGAYAVQAMLVDLGLHADPPLTVTLTKEAIRARRERHRPRRSARDERRMIESDLQRLHATNLAAGSLDTVLSVLGDPESGGDPSAALAAALGCDQETARLILSSPVSALSAGSRDRIATQIADAQRRLDAL